MQFIYGMEPEMKAKLNRKRRCFSLWWMESAVLLYNLFSEVVARISEMPFSFFFFFFIAACFAHRKDTEAQSMYLGHTHLLSPKAIFQTFI